MLYYVGRFIGWIGYLCNKYICALIAIVFPFHMSFKALQTENMIEDDIQALSFWIIFGFWNAIEFYFEWLICWIPLYYWLKTALLLWLIFPIKIFGSNIGGANVVYKVFLNRYLPKYEPMIDEWLEKVGITFEDGELRLEDKLAEKPEEKKPEEEGEGEEEQEKELEKEGDGEGMIEAEEDDVKVMGEKEEEIEVKEDSEEI